MITDTDLTFVIGAVVLCLSIPSLLSAWADGRPPRAAAIGILVGGVLVALALRAIPGGVDVYDLPYTFLRVIARILY